MPVPPRPTRSLHEAIRQARHEVPRYLFRAWHSGSGGDARLNTEAHVTPSAFLGKGESYTIFEVDEPELARSINLHLQNRPMKTFFSSWTPSLSMAIGMAATFAAGAHVAVIDTTLLPERNVVYCTGSQRLKGFGFLGIPGEYHVFGVVSVAAYQAVPAEGFSDELGAPTVRMSPLYELSVKNAEEERVKMAIRAGRLFNESFALVIAVYLLNNTHQVVGTMRVCWIG